MNSTTLSSSSAPNASAKTARARSEGARSASVPGALLRDDVGVEPLLPRGQRLGTHLVVHDVGALLPLLRRRENAWHALEAGRNGRLRVRGPDLERRHDLL